MVRFVFFVAVLITTAWELLQFTTTRLSLLVDARPVGWGPATGRSWDWPEIEAEVCDEYAERNHSR